MTLIDFALTVLILAAPIVIANVLAWRDRPLEIRIFHALLFLANGFVAFVALVLVLIPQEFLDNLQTNGTATTGELRPLGLILLAAALLSAAVSTGPVRGLLARITPIKSQSPVHTLALIISVYLVAQGAMTLIPGGLEELAESAVPASIGFVVISELAYIVVGLMGIGFPIRRRGKAILERLGVARITAKELAVAIGITAVITVLWGVFAALWTLASPDQVGQLEDVNDALLGNFNTVWEWLILAVAAGVGEELLFRGALQPAFGLVLTSALFAAVHVNFGYTPAFLFIFVLAIVLGWLRKRYNTTVSILVHAGYNFAQGLLVLLAQALEGIAS